MKKPNKFKRLFYDIETSPNLVFSWNIGYDIQLNPESIVHERAIICVCWKIEGESKVHSLSWNNGDDKKLVQEFAKVLNDCDETIGHNNSSYDEKWIRTRCMYHGVSLAPDLRAVDTLRLAKRGFRMNSNKLDFIARFLGVGKKTETGGFNLWRDIVLKNDKKALKKMISYCANDVLILEKVFNKLNPYVLSKSHKGVHAGGEPFSCPECGKNTCISNGMRTMANGLKKIRLHCKSCGKYHSVSQTVYELAKPLLEK